MARIPYALVGLVLLGGLAPSAPALCGNEHDAAALPAPEVPLRAASEAGLDLGLVAGDASPEATTDACGGLIRPGARLDIGTTWCTANWVLRDAQGALYIGTAGHCIPSLAITSIVVPGLGDIGDPAFTTGNGGVGNDVALIRIDPALYPYVEPSLCRWGGAHGVAHPGAAHSTLLMYGWGNVYGAHAASRARAGELSAAGWGASSLLYTAATNGGDSGAPLMDDSGLAVGVHTHTSVAGNAPVAGVGLKYGTRLDWALTRASQELGPLQLVTSPVPVSLT